MYMPNLIPRDVHHLWLQKERSSPGISRNSTQQNNNNNNNGDEPSIFSTSHSYAPPLSSYSSDRPGALVFTQEDNNRTSSRNGDKFGAFHTDQVQNDIHLKLRHLKSISTLGYDYLAPVGVSKTMAKLDEETAMKKHLEQQQYGIVGSGMDNEPTTVENLRDEASEMRNDPVNYNTAEEITQERPNAVDQQLQRDQNSEEDLEQRTPAAENVDLDDDIPEADDNSYSFAYDDGDVTEPQISDANEFESQYDRGFMVTEQYESQEQPELEADIQGQQQQTQFVTPVRNENSNGDIGRFVQNNLRSLSGSTSFNTTNGTSDNSFDHVNASINESDLDMTIDE